MTPRHVPCACGGEKYYRAARCRPCDDADRANAGRPVSDETRAKMKAAARARHGATEVRDAHIRSLRAEGLAYAAIATAMGVCVTTAWKACRP